VEATAITLARKAGSPSPPPRRTVAKKSVLLVRRFDRMARGAFRSLA